MSNYKRIRAIHSDLMKKLSIGNNVEESDINTLVNLIEVGKFEDSSERQFLRSILLFWNSSAELSPLPEQDYSSQETSSDSLIKRRQAKLGQVEPTFFDKLNWRK